MPPDVDPANAGKDVPHARPSKRAIIYAVMSRALRDQLGDEMFERIEAIYSKSIAFREASRVGDVDVAAQCKSELNTLLTLPLLAQKLHVVRAFSYFSQLLNISEDVDQVQKLRQRAIDAPLRGSIDAALARVAAAGVSPERVLEWFMSGDVLVAPVLTAHPTEVQRKSILDVQRDIARLLQERMGVAQLSPEDEADNDGALFRCIVSLWQTAMLRMSKLKVTDEINNALEHYKRTFLHAVPRLYLALEKRLAALGSPAAGAAPPALRLPPLLRIGSWIGGDRDGNPFVDAATLRYAVEKQAGTAFEHYLDEVNQLVADLGMSSRLISATPELAALASSSGVVGDRHADEPYRLALKVRTQRLNASRG